VTSDADAQRIRQLEREVEILKEDVKNLTAMQNQFLGMGNLAAFGVKAIGVLGGVGLITILYKIVQWLNAPITVPR